MKRPKFIKYYFILFLFLFRFNSLAQNYIPFPDSNAFWSQGNTYNDGTQLTVNIYTLFVNGDTILNGINYKNLFSSGTEYIYSLAFTLISSTTHFNSFYAYFREDSLKHIYVYNFGVDQLVYDFNLQLNDTLDYLAYPFILEPGTYVSSIDSILLGSNYRKRYHLSVPNLASDYITLTEGIGSSFGLLDFTAPPFANSRRLFCFRNDEGNYILDSLNCNYVNIDEYEKNNSFSIFPNPSTGKISLKIEEKIKSNFKIKIYNQLYKEIFNNIVEVKNEKTIQIPLILTKGIYFILIQYGDKTEYLKCLIL